MLIGVIVDELHVDVECVTVGVGKGPGFTSISPDRRRSRYEKVSKVIDTCTYIHDLCKIGTLVDLIVEQVNEISSCVVWFIPMLEYACKNMMIGTQFMPYCNSKLIQTKSDKLNDDLGKMAM